VVDKACIWRASGEVEEGMKMWMRRWRERRETIDLF
jgi:hypothetical protein